MSPRRLRSLAGRGMDFEESIRTDEMVRYGPGGRPDRGRKGSKPRRAEREPGARSPSRLSTAARVVWGVFLVGLVGLGSLFGKAGNRASANRGAGPQVVSSKNAAGGSTVITKAELEKLRG